MNTRSTTRQTNRLLKSWATLIGTAVMATTPAMADDTSKFENASTVSAKPDETRAPHNNARKDDELVILDEWLTSREEVEQELSSKEKLSARSHSADFDADGVLTYDGFPPNAKDRKHLADFRKRTHRVETDMDSFITLDEWLDLGNETFADSDEVSSLGAIHFTSIFPDRNGPEKANDPSTNDGAPIPGE